LTDASVFPPGGLAATAVPAPGFAVAAFDPAAARRVDSPETDDLNFFDGALCDARAVAFAVRLSALLADFFAVALRAFAAGVLAELFDWARVAFPAEDLGDFLRVFLDIRLPFVAFGRSIIGLLRALPW
jgi:hypothetical protein